MADVAIPPFRFTPPTLGDAPASRLTGRPEAIRERLVVPGRPQAEANRPANAPGRIPVAATPLPVPQATEAKDSSPYDAEAIQEEVENSQEIKALRDAGYIKENPLRKAKKQFDLRSQGERRERPELTAPAPTESRPASASREAMREDIERAANPRAQEPRRADPLALDLDGNGLQTSGIENGVRFDIDADGRLDQTSFVSGGDAFLAIDSNGNGRIDDGRELFGDQSGDANGYLALSRYDDNSDGVIDHSDTVFQQLRLFTMSADGSQTLRSLDEGGIAAISLGYSNSTTALNEYDTIAQHSTFTRVDGSEGESGDLLLGYRTL